VQPTVQTGGSRGTALHELDKPMNPKLRGSLNKQVNKVRHDFHFDYSDVTLAADSHNDLLEPLIDAVDIFWAPHDMKFALTNRCCGDCASQSIGATYILIKPLCALYPPYLTAGDYGALR
jgi:hypothetical protein